jgi:hypothetical protein
VMVIAFFNYEGAVHPQYTPQSMAWHRESQKWEACQWQIHHDIAFSCSILVLLQFLAKYCTPQVWHPPFQKLCFPMTFFCSLSIKKPCGNKWKN